MDCKMLNATINKEGSDFYLKWKKDTRTGLIIPPLLLLFVFTCFTMIVGISLKLLLILVLPVVYIITVFIYIPLFVRRKYINNMAKSIDVKDDIVAVKTYKWFSWEAINKTIPISKVKIVKSIDDSFFRGKTIYLMIESVEDKPIYLIGEFFENIDDLTNQFK